MRNRVFLVPAALAGLLVCAPARASYNPVERVLLDTQTAANSASLEFTNGINSTYRMYLFAIGGIKPATDAAYLRLRVSTNGGSTWVTSSTAYQSMGRNYCAGGAWGWFTSGGGDLGEDRDNIALVDPDLGNGNLAREDFNGTLIVVNPADGTRRTRMRWWSVMEDPFSDTCMTFGSGTYKANTAVNGFQFSYHTGNISVGVIKLYGIR